MKLKYPFIIIAMVGILIMLTGCGGSGEEGMSFFKLTDCTTYNFYKYYEGDPEEAYLCVVNGYTDPDLTIPATYKDKPVVAVATGSDDLTRVKIKHVVIPEGVLFIESGFSSYSSLESVSFPSTLRGIFNSFSGCSALTSVNFTSHDKMIIRFSFNRCKNLESVVYSYGTNDVSDDCFMEDPKLPGSASYDPSGSIATETYETVNESEYIESMKDLVDSGNDWARGLMNRAIDKLYDEGSVSVSKIAEDDLFAFDSQRGVAYPDDETGNRLSSEFVPDGPVICAKYSSYTETTSFMVYTRPLEADPSLSDYDFIDVRIHTCDDAFARSIEECKYLIIVAGVTSNIEKEVYMGGIDRNTTSTVVMIVDVASEEVVHIEHIGTVRPSDVTQFATGRMMEDEAVEYIMSICSNAQ